MVMYDTLYNDDMIDTSFHDKVTINIGGTCTVRYQDGKVIDLISSMINYNTKKLCGKNLKEINYGFREWDIETTAIPLEQIDEIIFEGFIITPQNRETILKLIHEETIKLTKIPRRD